MEIKFEGEYVALIRISESDNWIVDYDKERGMYRVSVFEDGHFKDEFWFDAYEGKEVRLPSCSVGDEVNMKNIELELKEYICNYCIEKNMSIDIRFQCFGDKNKFYTNNTEFSVDCASYGIIYLEDLKQFFVDYLDEMLKNCKYPINRVALYIQDILHMDKLCIVTVGGCIFVDDALT